MQDIIIGIYNGCLDKQGKYSALIGLDILDYEGGIKDESEFAAAAKV